MFLQIARGSPSTRQANRRPCALVPNPRRAAPNGDAPVPPASSQRPRQEIESPLRSLFPGSDQISSPIANATKTPPGAAAPTLTLAPTRIPCHLPRVRTTDLRSAAL